MRPRPHAAVWVLAAALVLTACSGPGGYKDFYQQARSPREAPGETTTDELTSDDTAEGFVSALNGLRYPERDLVERRVLAVKIDNHPAARPQAGLDAADVVAEFLVEGGFTRFIALFHGSDTERLGPIRSLRPNDPQAIAALGATLVISGGQAWIQQIAVAHEVPLIGEGPGTFRVPERPAPHDLYGSTLDLRRVADERGNPDDPPQPWLAIGDGRLDAPAEHLTVTWAIGDEVEWRWDADDAVYRRWTNGLPHEWIDADGTAGQIETDVLVFIVSRFYAATPPPGAQGTPVPAVDTVGEGRALVFAHGRMWEGEWERRFPTDPFTLTDADGSEVTVPAGRHWVSFLPDGQPVDVG